MAAYYVPERTWNRRAPVVAPIACTCPETTGWTGHWISPRGEDHAHNSRPGDVWIRYEAAPSSPRKAPDAIQNAIQGCDDRATAANITRAHAKLYGGPSTPASTISSIETALKDAREDERRKVEKLDSDLRELGYNPAFLAEKGTLLAAKLSAEGRAKDLESQLAEEKRRAEALVIVAKRIQGQHPGRLGVVVAQDLDDALSAYENQSSPDGKAS